MTPRVLVTGAAGFIGRHVLPLLSARGFETLAVDRAPLRESPPGVAWREADLLDTGAVERLVADCRPTHLLHLAWHTEPGRYWTAEENLEWVQASLALFRAFGRHGGKRAVGAGTCAEYAWDAGTCRERETPLRPATLYGACKLGLGLILERHAAQQGLSSAWGRVFFLYGPHERQERLVPSVMRALLRGEPARCTHGNQVRDFLHVRDVAAAFVHLLCTEVSGPVNIASGQPVELKTIIRAIADLAGRPDLVQLGALPAPAGEPAAVTADVSRLRDEVGWQPHLALTDGLRETLAYWKKAEMPAQRRAAHGL